MSQPGISRCSVGKSHPRHVVPSSFFRMNQRGDRPDVAPDVPLFYRPVFSAQLCLVRFTPSGTGAHRHRLKCVLNNDPGSTHEAELIGQGAVPAIQMLCTDKEYRGGCLSTSEASSSSPADMERDVVYLRPTCVGIVYSGTLKVRLSKTELQRVV